MNGTAEPTTPAEPLTAPSWVTEWYPNNPHSQRLATIRYNEPVTTAAERETAKAFVLAPSHGCASCGKFAFPVAGTVCYWCTSGRAP